MAKKTSPSRQKTIIPGVKIPREFKSTPDLKTSPSLKRPDRNIPEGDYSVFVDVVLDDGLLWFEIRNTNAHPVLDVSVTFRQKISGMAPGATPQERMELNGLAMFHRLRFLAPEKSIRVFIDTAASYFRRKQPLTVTTDITCRYPDGKRFRNTITHDLRIYKDLPQ